MNTQLKDKIIKYVQKNSTEFQLVHSTVHHFRAYIYDSYGNYLIDGEEVANFIKDFINLYTK